MSYLLFLDESGHDHRTMPYEVRGGVALHASELWPFVQDMQRLELASFGTTLNQFQAELKGWRDDWRPGSHTAAVLVERAAVASWRLRRCVRAEADLLMDLAEGS